MDRQRLKEIMQDCLHQKNETGEWFGAQYGQKNQGETPYEQGGAFQESRDFPIDY